MRVGLLTQWFPPERVRLPLEIAETLADRGHEVDVVTGFPNYPSGEILEPYSMKPYQREELRAGITVHRCALYPSHDRSAVRRAANYLSFAATASAASSMRVQSPDVWLVYSSPITTGLPTLVRRRPTAVLLQDLWPDSVFASAMADGGHRTRHLLRSTCDRMYRRADAIGVISPGMAEVLEQRGINPRRIHYTPNWVATDHLMPKASAAETRARHGLPQLSRVLMYAGNVGPLQHLQPLVEAAATVPEVTLAIVGDGVDAQRLRDFVDSRALTNIRFLGQQPASEMGDLYAAADAVTVSLKDDALLSVTMPSKVQACLAAGRPILAHASGDAATVVVASGAGWAVPPGDVAALTQTLCDLVSATPESLHNHARAARAHYEREFAVEVGGPRLENLLVAAIQGSRL